MFRQNIFIKYSYKMFSYDVPKQCSDGTMFRKNVLTERCCRMFLYNVLKQCIETMYWNDVLAEYSDITAVLKNKTQKTENKKQKTRIYFARITCLPHTLRYSTVLLRSQINARIIFSCWKIHCQNIVNESISNSQIYSKKSKKSKKKKKKKNKKFRV